jgi:alginate O-acetyltransferase complex protein AlgI
MLFNSIQFLIFFPLVVVIYFTIPYKYRWIFLVAASYYFYMCWRADYIIIIIASTVVNYYAGIMMEKSASSKKKSRFLLLSLFFNLGLLFIFKYFNFFNNSLREFLNIFNIFYDSPIFRILLPVGISFYTFQTLSYIIDVYRGQRKAEYHLGYFAAYVSFFPQLLAGPIARSTNLLPQFFEKQDFDEQRVSDGLKLMLWGFFKKIVIADRLAILVNQVYNNMGNYEGVPLLLATYFFAFQIYCDFSGYSDIAIGAAQVMGFKLINNFNRPYYATSISEFWKRWHISLSTWLRDYIFLPISYSLTRKFPRKKYFRLRADKIIYSSATAITFLICGLWHGASWTFVLWGGIHGFYLLFAIWTKDSANRIYNFFKLRKGTKRRELFDVFLTFHLVLFAWIFFRANSFNDALYILSNIFPLKINDFILLLNSTGAAETAFGLTKRSLILVVLAIFFMEVIHLIQTKINIRNFISNKPLILRWAIYYALLIAIISFGEFSMKEFIYFQF